MRYTYLTVSESGSFAAPYPDDVYHADSKAELEIALGRWENQHWRVGSTRVDASLWVCIGNHESIEYPDYIAFSGPRGGFNMTRA